MTRPTNALAGTLLLGLLAQAAHAQTSPLKAGTVQVSGGLGYYQQHNEESQYRATITDYSLFGAYPAVGVFLSANWVLGLGAGYNASKNTYSTAGTPYYTTQKARGYSVGPFAQYYHLLTDKFGLSGTVSAAYSHSSSDSRYVSDFGTGSRSGTGNGLTAALTPSLLFFPVSRLAIGASVGGLRYSSGEGTVTDTGGPGNSSKGSTFEAAFGLDRLAFSGTYYFQRN